MSKDDYHVIVFKVLTYFYECLKAGVVPKLEKASELASVEPVYWGNIVSMMLENGYIADVSRTRYKCADPQDQIWVGRPRITENGIEYLMTNSLMAKAKTLLGETFFAVVQTAIAATQML
jgi:hypothetical protein